MAPAPADPRTRIASARLCLLLTRKLCRTPPLDVLGAALRGGVDLVQVRESDLADLALVTWVREVLRVCAAAGVPVIVNNRPDVALVAGAHGVHLGQTDLPPEGIRALCGERLLIGWSTHAAAEIEAASALPVDYCGLGPVFDTSTKGLLGRGLGLVRDALPRARKPTFVIGGITVENVSALAAAGVRRIAVSAAICGAPDPAAAARVLLAALL